MRTSIIVIILLLAMSAPCHSDFTPEEKSQRQTTFHTLIQGSAMSICFDAANYRTDLFLGMTLQFMYNYSDGEVLKKLLENAIFSDHFSEDFTESILQMFTGAIAEYFKRNAASWRCTCQTTIIAYHEPLAQQSDLDDLVILEITKLLCKQGRSESCNTPTVLCCDHPEEQWGQSWWSVFQSCQ